jgi:hypothetical protein
VSALFREQDGGGETSVSLSAVPGRTGDSTPRLVVVDDSGV